MKKKTYVEPEVTKVEFEFNETIASSYCKKMLDGLQKNVCLVD